MKTNLNPCVSREEGRGRTPGKFLVMRAPCLLLKTVTTQLARCPGGSWVPAARAPGQAPSGSLAPVGDGWGLLGTAELSLRWPGLVLSLREFTVCYTRREP